MLIEADWRNLALCRQMGISASAHDWLSEQGSLTSRLVDACHGKFRVNVICQVNERPYVSEQRLLGMRSGEFALLREVQLMCDEVPRVFARTVIPVSSLKGAARRLTTLGSRPLGHLLFLDPGAKRGLTQVARLQSRHTLHKAAAIGDATLEEGLWARRTLYLLAGQPLLVNEVFLPALPL